MELIPLTQGKFAKVDDWNYEWLSQWKWCVLKIKNGDCYARRSMKTKNGYKTVYMHSLIMNAKEDEKVDHRFHDTLDNQEHNMRKCTHACTFFITFLTISNIFSIHKGVSFVKSTKRWLSNITINHKSFYLGCFDNEIEAAESYNIAAIKNFGEFALLNILDRGGL